MLADKLKAAKAAAKPIEYVGGYTQGFAGTLSPVTITFGGNLTGGLASSASPGDLVLVYGGIGGTSSSRELFPTGYTTITYAQGTFSTLYAGGVTASYKVMGDTPDTSFELPLGTQNVDWAGGVVIQVWRNVDEDYPVEGFTTTSGDGTLLINPSAITPTTPGAVIVAGGAAGYVNFKSLTYSSSDLEGMQTRDVNDTRCVAIGVGYKFWGSGSFDPAQFTMNRTDSSAGWGAITLALRPKFVGLKPKLISSASTQNTVAGTTLTIAKPTGTQEGDLMIAFMAAGAAVSWTDFTFTNIATQPGNPSPSLRIAYKIAGSSEPSSYTFSGTASQIRAGSILTYRNASYDAVGAYATNSVTLTLTGPTASEDQCVLIGVAANAAVTANVRAAPGMVTRVDQEDATAPSYVIADELVLAGSTGTRSFNSGSGSGTAGILLTIKPA